MGNQQIAYRPSGHQQEVKMAAELIEQGELTMVDVTGFNHIADDTASEKVGGPALRTTDNSGGAAGDKTILIDTDASFWWAQFNLIEPTTAAQVDLSAGAAGSLDTITIDTVEVLGGAVAFDTSLAITAANAIAQINAANGLYFAYLTGTAEINIVERIVTREVLTIVSVSTTITSDDTNASGGSVLAQADIGDDLYAVTGRNVSKVAGNVVIGTVERVDDENNVLIAAKAGVGKVAIIGEVGSISEIAVDGTGLMTAVIAFTTSVENTALLIAADINLDIATHGYFAVASGDEVLIYQTSSTLNESSEPIVVTGALTNAVTQNVDGGEAVRVLVDLKAYGSA